MTFKSVVQLCTFNFDEFYVSVDPRDPIHELVCGNNLGLKEVADIEYLKKQMGENPDYDFGVIARRTCDLNAGSLMSYMIREDLGRSDDSEQNYLRFLKKAASYFFKRASMGVKYRRDGKPSLEKVLLHYVSNLSDPVSLTLVWLILKDLEKVPADRIIIEDIMVIIEAAMQLGHQHPTISVE